MRQIETPKATLAGPLMTDLLDVAQPPRPVQWVTAPSGVGFWLVTDYRLAREVLADQRLCRSEAANPNSPKIATYNPAPNAIISLDGPAHARVRRLVSWAFTEHRITALEPFVARLARDLLDELRCQQPPADFVAQVSARLPLQVLCHLLGVPAADHEIFGTSVDLLFRWDGDSDASRQQSVRLASYMTRLVASKRRSPDGDLISELIRSAEPKGGITNRDLVTLCLSLLMAGYDTTVDQITLSVLTLLLNQPLMKALLHNKKLVPEVVEELLRINPASYLTFPRMAVESLSLGGVTIRPGEQVVVFIMGANRDAVTFTSIEGAALRSHALPHLTFGHGAHYCLGASLARLQLTVLLRDLIERFPDLRLADDASSLDWKTGMATRGLNTMHVFW